MSNFLTSLARMAASKLVGGVVGLAAGLGVAVPADLSESATLAVSSALVVGGQLAYYVAARWLERAYPWIGKLMLWSGKQPVYEPPKAEPAGEPHMRRFGE
ncbi:hypothetical protein DQ384_21845 [Sphaerisporangium album]|uniref:Uncharacterized protein n=1 Tax=Sphaerisporangium album TaxID=509200 RepID=A0A367FGG1_9ACTN|nr:hypothetical protein [Sphaerisporangium album]RCG28999.1 hypothetical protein DQ384_21845 [Sphaerisporangium album]